jgi:hypothetical protein
MRVLADQQAGVELDAPLGHAVHLLDERGGVHHHPVPDDALLPLMQDPGGDQMQNELVRPHDHGMARIMPPLIPRHHVRALRQEIYDLAFSFVAPLGADNH